MKSRRDREEKFHQTELRNQQKEKLGVLFQDFS